ncbi:MAG TPA: AAA family ATPase [Chthonomonadaceae bacterium]|nr:AAA family ATPase [Chthonomonadaceae bacterium]
MATEYVRHFGMQETPFARNHDPKWFFLSGQFKEAAIKTRWMVEENAGLALIRGDVGHGKSFLIEYLTTTFTKLFGWKCAQLQNTGTISSPRALLGEVLTAFGLKPEGTSRKMQLQLETWLLQQAIDEEKKVVLFIDEAQTINSRAFPVIRDLLNLQTRERILLQIVLSAQLNIDRKIAYFPALQSRIASVSTLSALTATEADSMLLHRFKTAGARDPFRICPADAMRALYAYSEGRPRDLLTITEAAMQEAYLQGATQIHAEHVVKAAKGLECRRPQATKQTETIVREAQTGRPRLVLTESPARTTPPRQPQVAKAA